MRIEAARGFVADVRLVLRAKGIARGLTLVPGLVRYHRTRARTRAANERLARADGFDATHGTETSGFLWGAERGVAFGADGELAFATGTGPADSVHAPLAALGLDYRQFVFVDVGCGLGKPLLVAARFPFQRLIGIDLAETVIAAARRNIAIVTQDTDPRFELRVEDATTFEVPLAPTVYYLYNPFGAATLGRFVRRLEASLVTHPRPVAIIYAHATARHIFDRSPLWVELRTFTWQHVHVVYGHRIGGEA